MNYSNRASESVSLGEQYRAHFNEEVLFSMPGIRMLPGAHQVLVLDGERAAYLNESGIKCGEEPTIDAKDAVFAALQRDIERGDDIQFSYERLRAGRRKLSIAISYTQVPAGVMPEGLRSTMGYTFVLPAEMSTLEELRVMRSLRGYMPARVAEGFDAQVGIVARSRVNKEDVMDRAKRRADEVKARLKSMLEESKQAMERVMNHSSLSKVPVAKSEPRGEESREHMVRNTIYTEQEAPSEGRIVYVEAQDVTPRTQEVKSQESAPESISTSQVVEPQKKREGVEARIAAHTQECIDVIGTMEEAVYGNANLIIPATGKTRKFEALMKQMMLRATYTPTSRRAMFRKELNKEFVGYLKKIYGVETFRACKGSFQRLWERSCHLLTKVWRMMDTGQQTLAALRGNLQRIFVVDEVRPVSTGQTAFERAASRVDSRMRIINGTVSYKQEEPVLESYTQPPEASPAMPKEGDTWLKQAETVAASVREHEGVQQVRSFFNKGLKKLTGLFAPKQPVLVRA